MKHCVIAMNDKFSRHYISIICHESSRAQILDVLQRKYQGKNKAAMLVALGDLNHMNAHGVIALHRDGGFCWETVKPVSHKSYDDLHAYAISIGAETLYCFDDLWQSSCLRSALLNETMTSEVA